MVLATGNTGGEVHRDIVFATGGFYSDKERMRLNHEDQTLYVGAHGEAGGTNITNLDVNGNLYVRSKTYLGAVANVSIGGGTSGKVLSTDGMGSLSWVSPQSGPTGDTGQGFNFRGAYNSGTFYQPYDVVTDGGFAYVSVQASHPGSGDNIFDTDFWQMFAARGAQGIQGEQGDTGAQGVSVTLQGTLEFIADLDEVVNPQQGDAWIVTESNGGDLYFYTVSSTWDNIGKIVGPEGPRGPQGLPGETGAQGEPGTPADTGNFTFDGDVLTSPTNGLIKIANTDDGAGIHSLNNRGRMWFDSTNNFYIVVDDTYQHSFSANGKVTFGGGYTFPNVAGTNGQILVTNSSGVLSWQDQAGLTNIFDQTLNSYDNVGFNLVSSPSYDFPNAGGISQQGGDLGRYNIFINAESNVVIDTDEGGYQWVFGNDGNLQLPAGGDIVDSNGDSVLGGGASTGNITFSDTTMTSTNGSIYIGFEPIASPAVSFTFNDNGTFSAPVVSVGPSTILNSAGFVECLAGADTVVYTSTDILTSTVKALFHVEGVEDGTQNYEAQSCEMMIARISTRVSGSVYGLAYTSNAPLATFTARHNSQNNKIEITCRPTSLTELVWVSTSATEMLTTP
jgi:hypothetical protein